MPICDFEGCDKHSRNKKGGLCYGHYRQKQRGKKLTPLFNNRILKSVYSLDNISFIPVGKGLVATIDEEDLHLINHCLWHVGKDGYVSGRSKAGISIRMHQLICPDFKIVDHINRNKLDNRRVNLREPITFSHSSGNTAGWKRRSSPYKGVSFEKRTGNWVARIQRTHLGTFNTAEQAAAAYNQAALDRWGDFAFVNQIPDTD